MKRMKGLGMGFIVVLSLCLVLAGCGNSQPTPTQQPTGSQEQPAKQAESTPKETPKEVITLNFNNMVTSEETLVVEAVKPWAEMVEAKTDGRVKVNLHYASSLGSPLSVLEDVVNGVYEIGVVLPHYYYDSSVFPMTLTNLPFAFGGDAGVENSSKIMKAFSDQFYDEIWKEVTPLAVFSFDDNAIFSTKPIKGIDDFKGLKVRTQGRVDSGLVEAWGGTPVTMPYTEMYSGLQSGVVDALLQYSVSSAQFLHLMEVAPYVTKTSFNRVPTAFVMSKEFFEHLPDDLKTLFEKELNPALQELAVKANAKSQETGYAHLNEASKEMIIPTTEAMDQLKPHAKQFWDQWVKDANDRGYPGEDMLNTFNQLLKDNGLPVPF